MLRVHDGISRTCVYLPAHDVITWTCPTSTRSHTQYTCAILYTPNSCNAGQSRGISQRTLITGYVGATHVSGSGNPSLSFPFLDPALGAALHTTDALKPNNAHTREEVVSTPDVTRLGQTQKDHQHDRQGFLETHRSITWIKHAQYKDPRSYA